MNKQEKILFATVIIALGLGATFYVQNAKNTSSLVNQQVQQQPTSNPTTSTINQTTGSDSTQNTETVSSNSGSVNTNQTSGQANTTTTITKSSQVTYQVPEGHTETLTVNATIKDGVITSVTFSENPTNRDSKEYYQSFQSSFSQNSVVGKKPSNISLSRVGAASLTTAAFNSALAKM